MKYKSTSHSAVHNKMHKNKYNSYKEFDMADMHIIIFIKRTNAAQKDANCPL